jgi:hypothetical protein
MDVFDMVDEIRLTPDLMFPKTALPDSLFFLPKSGCRPCGLVLGSTLSTEITFYQAPTFGKIPVFMGQCPDAMQVVRQQNKCVDLERMPLHDTFKYSPQQGDIVRSA